MVEPVSLKESGPNNIQLSKAFSIQNAAFKEEYARTDFSKLFEKSLAEKVSDNHAPVCI